MEEIAIKPPLFMGSSELSLDKKTPRLMIPAEVRRAAPYERYGESLYVVIGRDGRLWLYPEKWFLYLRSKWSEVGLGVSDEEMEITRFFSSLTERADIDKQGRVMLEAWQVEAAGLKDSVTLCGDGDHLVLWNTDELVASRKALMSRAAEMYDRVRDREKTNASTVVVSVG